MDKAWLASEKATELFFSNSMDLMGIADMEGFFRRVNPAFSRVLGWSQAELTSKPWVDFVHPDDVERTIREHTEQVARGEAVVVFENRYRVKGTDDYVWLRWSARPMAEPALVLAVGHPIAEVKSMEARLVAAATAEATLGAIGTGVITTDTSGAVRSMNAGAERIFADADPRHIEVLVTPSERTRLRELLLAAAQDPAAATIGPSEFTTASDLGEVPVAMTLQGVPEQDIVVVVCRDLSQWREAEQRADEAEQRSPDTLVQLVQGLATATEFRDPYTAGHQRRVAEIALAIAAGLGLDADGDEGRGLYLGCLIHDIGKLYIPAEVLNRPGHLTALEFDLIKQHPVTGYQTISHVDFADDIQAVVLHHHERLDGSGYPDGLRGDEIPLAVRIASVADMVEAMTAHRPYRPGRPLEVAIGELRAGRGSKFDADVVDVALDLLAGTAEKRAQLRMPAVPAESDEAGFLPAMPSQRRGASREAEHPR